MIHLFSTFYEYKYTSHSSLIYVTVLFLIYSIEVISYLVSHGNHKAQELSWSRVFGFREKKMGVQKANWLNYGERHTTRFKHFEYSIVLNDDMNHSWLIFAQNDTNQNIIKHYNNPNSPSVSFSLCVSSAILMTSPAPQRWGDTKS